LYGPAFAGPFLFSPLAIPAQPVTIYKIPNIKQEISYANPYMRGGQTHTILSKDHKNIRPGDPYPF
jgi:hypothetical protein